MYTVILFMSETQGETISHTFQHNYPNYTINFTISKAFPLNRIKIERNVLWICDRDKEITALLHCLKQSAAGSADSPDMHPLPVIAFSHKDNVSESLMGPSWLVGSPEELTPAFIEEVMCRCQGIPLKITQTKRCLIRELTSDDLSFLLLLQQENKKNPGGCFFPEECAAPDEFLKNYIRHQYSFYGYGLFGVLRKSDGEFMGIAGFSCTDLASADAEISYALLKKYQHQGYAREAVLVLLAEGSRRWHLQAVTARIQSDNAPSIRLAAALHIPYVDDCP